LLAIGGSYPYMQWELPASNFVITEIGFHTDSYPNGVTEAAQGNMVVNTLLNGLVVGMRQTIIYELIDEVWAGYQGAESHFGIFRNDQTPKPAARALHFLSQLLNDTTTVSTPGQLTFTLQGIPVGSQYLLFQNSNGTYFLVLWNNAPVYDPVQNIDVSVVASQARLTVSDDSDVNAMMVYDIYSTADDTQPLPPIATVSDTNTVLFSMSDQAVVIAIYSDSHSSNFTLALGLGLGLGLLAVLILIIIIVLIKKNLGAEHA